MVVFAYCCASFAKSTRKAAGVEPLLSPPVTAGSLDLALLEGNDLLYFDLHGEPGREYWLGDDMVIALMASQVRELDLDGTVVFAVNCFLADEDSPMMEALLDAGARYVIGAPGKNWAGTRTVYGASLLGTWVRRLMWLGVDPLKALAIGKERVRRKMAGDERLGRKDQVFAADDTLGFRAYYREA